ncbi:cation-transporting P-type ATPase, partial [Parabacteroides distasonis]
MANREKQVDEVYQYDPQTALTMVGSQLRGLSSEEVLHRQEVYGPNQLDKPAGEPLWLTFLKNFSSLMAILLWIGGFVAFFFTDTPELGIAIWAVNVINGCFSFIQE